MKFGLGCRLIRSEMFKTLHNIQYNKTVTYLITIQSRKSHFGFSFFAFIYEVTTRFLQFKGDRVQRLFTQRIDHDNSSNDCPQHMPSTCQCILLTTKFLKEAQAFTYLFIYIANCLFGLNTLSLGKLKRRIKEGIENTCMRSMKKSFSLVNSGEYVVCLKDSIDFRDYVNLDCVR